MAETENLGLYLPSRMDKIPIDETLASNFNIIDEAFKNLPTVSVKMFGAAGNGTADDSQAFREAMGSGGKTVFVPAGTYRVSGIKVPSNTRLIGAGKDITIIKLTDNAPATANVITNMGWSGGNKNIILSDFTVDWNRSRKNGMDDIEGQPNACNVLFVNTDHLWIKRVKSINARRHCFDVSASIYHHEEPPTKYENDGCNYVWIDECEATGAGDDNFTTHFSNYIWITNCHSYSPSGLHFEGNDVNNSNCFEIDDGTKHAVVSNCYAYNGARGFESKGHEHSPAPMDVKFVNCIAEKCLRAFDIRHNGHALANEPESASAFDVQISNCTAINPVKFASYPGLDPRALAIAAYNNVNVNNFNAIGGSDGVADDVISIYQKARNINLSNISVRGFTKADTDIRVNGGDQASSHVTLVNISLEKSARRGIVVTTGMTSCSITNLTARGRNAADSWAIYSQEENINIIGTDISGYTTPVNINGHYMGNTNRLMGSISFGNTEGYAKHDVSAVIASSGTSVADGSKSAVIGSSGSKATGERSAVLSSDNSTASGSYSGVMAARDCISSGARAAVIGSYGVDNPQTNSLAGGYNNSGTPRSSARKWQLNSQNGNIVATGSITHSGSFTDYGEYFESLDGKEIPTGHIVALEGDKIRLANEEDDLLGVISETAGIILGEANFAWHGRYKKNEFGGYVYEEVKDPETGEMVRTQAINEEYDEEKDEEYIPRSERPEWHVVGLVGQVFIRVDDTVKPGDHITAKDGIGTATSEKTGWKVMKITSPFDEEKGYGIAFVFIR